MLLRRETGNEHEKREIEKSRERNERIGNDVTDRVSQGLS